MASNTCNDYTSNWEDSFNVIKTNHDAAYRKIDEALRLEEEGQSSRVIFGLYKFNSSSNIRLFQIM